MTVGRAIELRAFAWDEGEEPIELPTADNSQDTERDYTFNRLQRMLMGLLESKEYGKLVRFYPATTHPPMPEAEIVLHYRAFTDPYRGRQVCGGTDVNDMNKRFEEMKQFCTQRVFSPAELYALKPVRVDYGDWHTVNVHLSNDVNYYEIDLDAVEKTERMETRTLVDYCSDGRRTWTLQTVWFDGKPVMVVNSSGRDGDEYHDRWITDAGLFGELIAFLRSFIPEAEVSGYVKASDKIPLMTEFYNATIHDYYDVEAQEPKKQ